jgi:hypothetical protein
MKGKVHFLKILFMAVLALTVVIGLNGCGGGGGGSSDSGGGDGGGGGATTYQTAEYFPLGQGDTWTYLEDGQNYSTTTVSGTEVINGTTAKKMLEDSGDYTLMTSDSNGITYYKVYEVDESGWEQFTFSPPGAYIPGEVSVGNKYTGTSTLNYTNSEGSSLTGTVSIEVTLQGTENVTVPAGTFNDCLKFSIKRIMSSGQLTESYEGTLWLAKGVGRVKETGTTINTDNSVDQDTFELVSATVGGGGGTSDITAPTVPTGLTATAVSTSQIDLAWTASTDTEGVVGYKVYVGDNLLTTSTATEYSNTDLSANTQYCYAVSAYDAAGNESPKSNQVCATTLGDVYSLLQGKWYLNLNETIWIGSDASELPYYGGSYALIEEQTMTVFLITGGVIDETLIYTFTVSENTMLLQNSTESITATFTLSNNNTKLSITHPYGSGTETEVYDKAQ